MKKTGKQSAGLLVYKWVSGQLNVLLVHPGGPFWKNRDAGAWSLPKGEYDANEDPLTAAIREFTEETSLPLSGVFVPLGSVTQKSGKVVHAWSVAHDLDTTAIKSNKVTIEWPPKSGKQISVPEIDRGEWCNIPQALERINPAQQEFISRLLYQLE